MMLTVRSTLLLAALALGTAVLFAVLATPGNAAGGSKYSCSPAPYYMWYDNEDYHKVSHAGIGSIGPLRIIHKLTGPEDKQKYRIPWKARNGYVICKAELRMIDGSARALATNRTSGHWDWEAYLGTPTKWKRVKVWVRQANG